MDHTLMVADNIFEILDKYKVTQEDRQVIVKSLEYVLDKKLTRKLKELEFSPYSRNCSAIGVASLFNVKLINETRYRLTYYYGSGLKGQYDFSTLEAAKAKANELHNNLVKEIKQGLMEWEKVK